MNRLEVLDLLINLEKTAAPVEAAGKKGLKYLWNKALGKNLVKSGPASFFHNATGRAVTTERKVLSGALKDEAGEKVVRGRIGQRLENARQTVRANVARAQGYTRGTKNQYKKQNVLFRRRGEKSLNETVSPKEFTKRIQKLNPAAKAEDYVGKTYGEVFSRNHPYELAATRAAYHTVPKIPGKILKGGLAAGGAYGAYKGVQGVKRMSEVPKFRPMYGKGQTSSLFTRYS